MSTRLNPALVHYRYWTPADHENIRLAGLCLRKNRDVAMSVISRMPPSIHMASGPMTSGGLGSFEANMELFYRTVEYLIVTEKRNAFSQVPFETGMVAFHQGWVDLVGKRKYCWPILLEFYEMLFATGKFDTLHFIHGFESSIGARWEYDQCLKRGIKIRRLPKSLSHELMKAR